MCKCHCTPQPVLAGSLAVPRHLQHMGTCHQPHQAGGAALMPSGRRHPLLTARFPGAAGLGQAGAEALVVEHTGRGAMEEQKGTERSVAPSPLHPACPDPASAWHEAAWRSAVPSSWSQPCAADQGLRSHFFINYF